MRGKVNCLKVYTLYEHTLESLDPGDFNEADSVADMSMMTVTGAIIGPTANSHT